MIINSARGTHSSPGVYTREIDVTYSVKSLGITSLGLAGETVKGPAFEPIKIEKWSDYVDYFGPTSTEKFVGTGYPKYELPYIAKEYLKESRQLYVCRVLGLSGYNAGPAFFVTATDAYGTYVAAVLRSRANYGQLDTKNPCEPGDGDKLTFVADDADFTTYTEVEYDGNCVEVRPSENQSNPSAATVTSTSLGKFGIIVNGKTYNVSFNYGDSDYIYNVLGSNPLTNTECPLFVEAVYDYALRKAYEDGVAKDGTAYTLTLNDIIVVGSADTKNFNDYKQPFSPAATPWLVSEAHASKAEGGSGVVNVSKLFRAWTISDGNHANNEVKLSIQSIRPDAGTFDVVVRAMNDSDAVPVVLEKFSGCNLVVGDKNYVALRIGTIDGDYELKSKYIALEMASNVEDLSSCVPCGFLGYPLHDVSGASNFDMGYNCKFDFDIKPKRQYFGFSDLIGIDVDTLNYKGIANTKLSSGFHLDSIINQLGNSVTLTNHDVNEEDTYVMQAVDGKSGKNATVRIPRIVTEEYAKGTIYEDVNTRKFTVCFYGGFDGWDIYRKSRTNTDVFKATKYALRDDENRPISNLKLEDFVYLDLPTNANNSDYYAYLGAYRQFANPEGIDINVFATPGIDWLNNELLVDDALDVVEDPEDGRGGDALYIVTTPNKLPGKTDAIDDMLTPPELVELLENSSIDTSYAATYWPWVKFYDGDENLYINLPVTKDVIRNLAYTDNTSYP